MRIGVYNHRDTKKSYGLSANSNVFVLSIVFCLKVNHYSVLKQGIVVFGVI